MRWFDYPEDPPQLLLKKLVLGDNSTYEDARDFQDHWVQKLIEHLNDKIPEQPTKQAT